MEVIELVSPECHESGELFGACGQILARRAEYCISISLRISGFLELFERRGTDFTDVVLKASR